MKNESIFLEVLDSPVLKIVDYLIENRLFDYSKKDIIEGTGIGRATFFKYWNNLEKFGIVKLTRKFGKTKLYKLNEVNRIVKLLIAVDWALTEKGFEEVKTKIPIQITNRK